MSLSCLMTAGINSSTLQHWVQDEEWQEMDGWMERCWTLRHAKYNTITFCCLTLQQLLSRAIYCTKMNSAVRRCRSLSTIHWVKCQHRRGDPVKLYNIPQEVHQSTLPRYGWLDPIGKLHSVLAFLLTRSHSTLVWFNTLRLTLDQIHCSIHWSDRPGVSPLGSWGEGTTRCTRSPSCSSFATGSWPFRTCCCSRRRLRNEDRTVKISHTNNFTSNLTKTTAEKKTWIRKGTM